MSHVRDIQEDEIRRSNLLKILINRAYDKVTDNEISDYI